MKSQVNMLGEAGLALLAHEWFLLGVESHVSLEVGGGAEALVAAREGAGVRSLSSVDHQVLLKMSVLRE